MRSTAFAIAFLALSVSAATVDRTYNIDAMATTQPHALRTAARFLDPPPKQEWWTNFVVVDIAAASE